MEEKTEKGTPASKPETQHIRRHHLRKRETAPAIPPHEEKAAVAGKPARRRLPGNYWGYLLLLVFTIVLFTAFALRVDDTTLTVELKKMNVEQYASAADSGAVEASETNETAAKEVSAEQSPAGADSTAVAEKVYADSVAASTKPGEKSYYYGAADTASGERFLLIGDSMNEFLRIRLNDYCIKNGHKMDCVIWYGATTKQYGTCDTIAYFIRKYHPTYVILTIGSNELFIRDIINKRTDYVRHIVNQLGNIPFVWVGPPNWKEDTGINQLILQHVGPSRYFESKKLSFNRCKDGAHPTKSSAFNWLDHIAKYLDTEARHTIVMETPDTNYNKIPHTTILKMVRE